MNGVCNLYYYKWRNWNTWFVRIYLPYVSDCYDRLGVENGDIPDGNIQASSIYNINGLYHAHKGRLNAGSSWAAPGHQPWIQADVGYQTYVSGVATQGYGNSWVTSIKVSTFYMTTTDDEIFVSDGGGLAKVNITVLLHKCITLIVILMESKVNQTKQKQKR